MNQIIQKNYIENSNNFIYKKSNMNNSINKNKKLIVEFGNEIAEIPYGENFDILENHNAFYYIKDFIKKRKYQLQFIISFVIAVIFLIFFFFRIHKNHQQEKIAQELLNNYQLTTLYSDNGIYNSNKLNSNVIVENPFVIGMVKIDKIQLNYPILSETNNDLLKISICRFTGPMPNEIGNLCIAGHNYLDNRFFSRLDELEIGDTIEIYGISGQVQEYEIFKKYEVNYNDLSCTSQDIGNNKLLTLLTCDNSNKQKRLVIQAK